MKYGIFTLLALFALPGCSCMRKEDKQDRMQQTEKRMKKPVTNTPMSMSDFQESEPMMPDQMSTDQEMVPEMMDMDMAQEDIQF